MHLAVLLMTIRMVTGASEMETRTTNRQSTFELEERNRNVWAHVRCYGAPLDVDVPPARPARPAPGPRWGAVTHVELAGCGPPARPRPPALARALAARGVRVHALHTLDLADVPPDARFNSTHFAGLESLTVLSVRAAGAGRPHQLAGDFMLSLPKVSSLTLENEALAPLPERSPVGTATLVGGRSLGAWGGCMFLGNLRLRDWLVPAGPDDASADGWLAHCDLLLNVRAERMERASLRAALRGLAARRKLFSLELPDNALTTPDLAAVLPDSVTDLSILRVPHNNLTHIDNVLEAQRTLEKLDLSHNMLGDFMRTLRAVHAVRAVRGALRALLLDHNPLADYSDWRNEPWLAAFGRAPPLGLEMLSLVGTNTSRLCFPDWSSLRHLNLSDNNIEQLQFGQLPLMNNVRSLTVDLRRNPLREVHFNESDYNALINARRPRSEVVTVFTEALPAFDCECGSGWLARALRERRLELPAGARCRGGVPLPRAPPAALECDPAPCPPCRCRRQWATRTLVMHCDALGLHDFPKRPDLGELYLKGNHIHTIRGEDLPKTLTVIDLRDNNVTRVNATAAAALFEVVARRVWLAGNALACDCDNWPLLGALQAHRVQVEDYDNVTCSDGRALRGLSQEGVCGERAALGAGPGAWLGAGGSALVGLVALGGALLARYSRPLKVWLYARGWCLRWVREEELDSDRPYDVFLSFAHGDHELVAGSLLPELEGGCGYRVCVHYRDWTPGELIPTQITRSVMSSRRTVIVLSANFVNSVWGLAEFRAAHVSALSEGRVRVLAVALSDTPPVEELPEELRMYLRSTTYMRWDDPWFWDKFRYALPHRAAAAAGDARQATPRVATARVATPCDAGTSSGIELMLYE